MNIHDGEETFVLDLSGLDHLNPSGLNEKLMVACHILDICTTQEEIARGQLTEAKNNKLLSKLEFEEIFQETRDQEKPISERVELTKKLVSVKKNMANSEIALTNADSTLKIIKAKKQLVMNHIQALKAMINGLRHT